MVNIMSQKNDFIESTAKKNSIINNFSTVIEKLPKKEKQTYLACYISDDYIKEFSIDSKNDLLVVDYRENHIVNTHKLNDSFLLIETESSLYVAARDTQIKKGEAFIACTKCIPGNGQFFDFNLLFLDEKTNNASISGIIHSPEEVSNVTHLADNIYVATLGNKLFAFIIGYTKEVSTKIELNKTDSYDTSYG